MITILYAKGFYTNPSYKVLFDEFERQSNVELRVLDVNSFSIEAIAAEIEKSDCVVYSDMIFALAAKRHVDILAWYFPNPQHCDHYRSIIDLLRDKRAPQVLISFHFDLHARDHIFPLNGEYGEILDNVDALAWFYEKEPVAVSAVPEQYLDKWMQSYIDPHHTWKLITDRYKVRIELPFSIAAKELQHAAPHYKWDLCIAGANYMTRKVAQSSISSLDRTQAPYWVMRTSMTNFYRVHRYLKPSIQHCLNQYMIKYAHWGQFNLVSKSKVNFVCGSGYKYPVRKFFEIPAARSALVAYPFTGFEDYGFVDGVNTVATLPEDAGKAVKYLLDNDRIREGIAENGHKLVASLHSARKRVADLLECFRRVEKGSLRGAQFIKGKYEIY